MSNEPQLSPEMNAQIVELLRKHSLDDVEIYAAQYIEALQTEIAELKVRLNFILNSSGKMFVPPIDSLNRGED